MLSKELYFQVVLLSLLPTFDRCSLAYQQWIKNEIESAQISGIHEQRDQISILELLNHYFLALITYDDFELHNALEILEEVSFHEDELLNSTERRLKKLHFQLKDVLSVACSQITPNALLSKSAELLYQHFSKNPTSKGLFFVRDVKHTEYVTEWIKSNPELSRLIKPSSISGYSKKGHMTKEEQVSIIENFRCGGFNLLVSTSVLEEGLDVPDCNLVIRFQILSNEVADVQAQGRARAEESTMHTIVVSESPVHYNQLINNDKRELAATAVKYLSKAAINLSHLQQLQDVILIQREQRLRAEQDRKATWNASDVQLLCCKCSAFACNATSVSKYGTNPTSPSYIVPLQSFIKDRMKKMKRKNKPEPATASGFSRPFKIHCVQCSEEWGIWGCWKNGVQYPVLKCTSFIFHNKVTNGRENCRQWKLVPFDIPFYTEYNEQEVD